MSEHLNQLSHHFVIFYICFECFWKPVYFIFINEIKLKKT